MVTLKKKGGLIIKSISAFIKVEIFIAIKFLFFYGLIKKNYFFMESHNIKLKSCVFAFTIFQYNKTFQAPINLFLKQTDITNLILKLSSIQIYLNLYLKK